jgi:hypothetical protein
MCSSWWIFLEETSASVASLFAFQTQHEFACCLSITPPHHKLPAKNVGLKECHCELLRRLQTWPRSCYLTLGETGKLEEHQLGSSIVAWQDL